MLFSKSLLHFFYAVVKHPHAVRVMPNVRDKRRKLIGLWVFPEELARMNAACVRLGITRSDLLRLAATGRLDDKKFAGGDTCRRDGGPARSRKAHFGGLRKEMRKRNQAKVNQG